MDDLEARVFRELGDDTWVYPGHGRDTAPRRRAPLHARVARPRLVIAEMMHARPEVFRSAVHRADDGRH